LTARGAQRLLANMKAAREWTFVFAVGFGVVACSSSSAKSTDKDASSPGDVTIGPMSIAEFCNAFITANNTLFSRCLGGPVSTWALELPPQYSCASLEAAVAAGRVKYVASQAASCLEAYPSLSCSDLYLGPMECFGPLGGTAANGAACLTDGDCGGSSYCSVLDGSCQGTCAAALAAGASCPVLDSCVPGYICGGDSSSMTCISNVHPLANEGHSCAPVAATMPSIQCASGLTCSPHTSMCTKAVPEGAACTPGDELCAMFSYCDSSTMTCKAWVGAGETCGPTAAGEHIECLPQLFCKMATPTSPTGTCEPLGGAGASCAGGYECASDSCSPSGCSTPCTQE
jgi:hypothetical protein